MIRQLVGGKKLSKSVLRIFEEEKKIEGGNKAIIKKIYFFC